MTWCNAHDAEMNVRTKQNHTMKLGKHGRHLECRSRGVLKVALYWYAESSVLTHRSWCGDYTHTHTCTRTACTQHSHKHMHPRMHATLTHTHTATHAHNTHTHTRTHACTHQYTTRPTHTLTLKCSTYTCMRTHQVLIDTYTTRWFPRTGWSLVAPA